MKNKRIGNYLAALAFLIFLDVMSTALGMPGNKVDFRDLVMLAFFMAWAHEGSA